MFRKVTIAIIASLAFTSLTVYAVPITWTINDLVFDDGGTGNGSFVYNQNTGLFSDISISTTDGTTLLGHSYTRLGPIFVGPAPGDPASFMSILSGTGVPTLLDTAFALSFVSPLTNAGGSSALLETSVEYQCNTPGFCGTASGTDVKFKRFIVSGSVQATVPVPAATWLFGSGLLGLIGIARRKKAA